MDFYRRNELPETVKRYKTYTDQFQEWLMRTAVQRNVERATQILEQAKHSKGKKSYKISVEQQELLVDGIAKTNAPLEDTSGFRDLADAIRSRKEVTQYYKVTKKSDTGHAYFDGVLEGFKAALKNLMPGLYNSHNLEDEFSNFVTVQLPQADSTKDNIEVKIEDTREPEQPLVHSRSWNNSDPPLTKTPDDHTLTNDELELQQELRVLRFLYDFNRIRGIVRELWRLYNNGLVNAMTAALVTDLAQSHVQQNVAALVEDLAITQGGLTVIVRKLYEKMLSDSGRSQKGLATPQLSKDALRQILCMDAIDLFEAYLDTKHVKVIASSKKLQKEHPFLLFLRFFDVIRKNKLKLPLWDKFTEDMLLHIYTSKDWLAFGFQIMLDLQEVVHDDYRKLFTDITEHGLDISKLMRFHVDYEDRMWAVGVKPDYMARGDTKFSSVFLNPLNTLLAWIQELLSDDVIPGANSDLTTDVFVTVHSTLAGLSMWYFNKTYHSTAIGKVQWFIICLCHLYNAARLVGGLDIAWPDLDFIIEMHGTQRIFVGNPPTDPHDFLERFRLASCISSRFMASDYRHTGKFAPTASREVREKRGLMPHFPLEDTLKTFYGPNPKDDRWLKRHAIFNCLHQLRKTSVEPEAREKQASLKELQAQFTFMAAKITGQKDKKRTKKSSRVRVPVFSQMDDTYPGLFSDMKTELQAHELHSNFDYLSFYRRAFDLLLKIRGEILLDSDMQIIRRGFINMDPNPPNLALITELFQGLKVMSKDGQGLSSDMVPVQQLKRIAMMMKGLIREKGGAELERAKMRLSRDWDGLKAAYATEEADEA